MIITNFQERSRFLRFAIVGTIGAIVDFSTFNLLISVLNMIPVWANFYSFTMAVISNFIWNRYWTYPDSRSKKVPHQLLEYLIVNTIGVMIRSPIFLLLQELFRGFIERFPYSLPIGGQFWVNNLALAGAMGVVMFWNFYVNRFWTYADID